MSEISSAFWRGFAVGICLCSLVGIGINEYRYFKQQQELNQTLDESIQKSRKDMNELENRMDSIRTANVCKQRPAVCSVIS